MDNADISTKKTCKYMMWNLMWTPLFFSEIPPKGPFARSKGPQCHAATVFCSATGPLLATVSLSRTSAECLHFGRRMLGEYTINAALHLQSIWQQIYLAHFCLGLPTFVARRASGSSRSSGGNDAGSKDSRHQRDLTLEFS